MRACVCVHACVRVCVRRCVRGSVRACRACMIMTRGEMIIPNTQILAREIAMSEYSLAIQVFEYGARLYTVTLQVKG